MRLRVVRDFSCEMATRSRNPRSAGGYAGPMLVSTRCKVRHSANSVVQTWQPSRWLAMACIAAPDTAPSRYSENCERIDRQSLILPPQIDDPRRTGSIQKLRLSTCYSPPGARTEFLCPVGLEPSTAGVAPATWRVHGPGAILRFLNVRQESRQFRRKAVLPGRARSRRSERALAGGAI